MIMNRSSEIENVLESLGVDYRIVSDNYMISCPFHDDQRPSFGIRRDGVWNCFSCNESGNWKKLAQILGFKTKKLTFQELIKNKLTATEKSSNVVKLTELPYDFIEYGNDPPASVLERISLQNIVKYGVGEARTTFPRYFIIPISVNGYQSYICRHRTRQPTRNEKRWRFAEGFTKILFPMPEREVILVEGILDAFAIEHFGFAASACFGHSINDLQVSQLLSVDVEKIVFLFDSYEDHFSTSIRRTFRNVQQFFSVSVMRLSRDADEVDKEEFVEAYEKRIYLSDELDQMQVTDFRERVVERMNGG